MLKKLSLFALALAVYTTGMFAADQNAHREFIHHVVTTQSDATLVKGSSPKRFSDGFVMGPTMATFGAVSAYAVEAIASATVKSDCRVPHTAKTVFALFAFGGLITAIREYRKLRNGQPCTNTAMWLGWTLSTSLCAGAMFAFSPTVNSSLYRL